MNKDQILQEFFGYEEDELDEAAKKGRLPGTDPVEYQARKRRKPRHTDITRSQAAIRSNRGNRMSRSKGIKSFWRSAEGQRMKTHLRRRMKECKDLDTLEMCDIFLESLADLFNDEDALKETYLLGELVPEVLLDAALALDVISEFAWYMQQDEEDEEGESLYESIFEDENEDEDASFFEDDTDEDDIDEGHMTAKERKAQKIRRKKPAYKKYLKLRKRVTGRSGYRPDPKRSKSSKRAAKTARR